MPRRILKLRRFFEGPSPWALIAIAGMAFVIVSLYVVNHNAVARNERLLVQHASAMKQANQAIEYLCETTGQLDLIFQQFLAVGIRSLPTLPPEQRPIVKERNQVLAAAHIVLSDTRSCRKVTG